jgi:AcrR family transcriptional regulator
MSGRAAERRDVTRNRARLLAAADELLAARGEDATIESIARRAGLGVGTAYRHFASKQVLLQALFAARIDRILKLADEAGRIEDAGAALEFFLREAAAMQAGDRGLRDAISVSEGFEALSDQRQRLAAAVNALVGRARAAGAVRPDFEGTDVAVIFTIVGSVADDSGGDLWRRYLEIILDGIRPLTMPRRPLPVDAPNPEQLTAVMRNYHRNQRKTGQP